MRSAIEADTEVLRFFGAAQSSDVRHGVGPRVDRMLAWIAGQVQTNPNALTEMLPVVEFVASKYPLAWLNLAKLYREYDQLDKALDVLRRYLQKRPADADAWRNSGWPQSADPGLRYKRDERPLLTRRIGPDSVWRDQRCGKSLQRLGARQPA